MRDISYGRVLTSGVVAGVVINLGELLLNGVLLRRDWDAAMAALGRPAIQGTTIVLLSAMGLGLGLAMLMVHAVSLSRFGNQHLAAVFAGLVAWILAYGLGLGWSYAIEVLPRSIYLTTLAWSLPELVIAARIGALFYRDR